MRVISNGPLRLSPLYPRGLRGACIAAGGWMLWHGHLIGIGLILVGLLLIPALFVIARMIQYRRAVPILVASRS